jgi:type VI secretion system secreted protein Hcp
MAIYMNFNNIPGNVTESTHTGWIQLSSFNWGTGRSCASPVGAMADREATSPSLNEATVTKALDIASTKLMTEAFQGKGQTVNIEFTKTSQGAQTVYLSLTLSDTLIASFSTTSGGDRPSETYGLSFTKIEYKSTPAVDDNTSGEPITVSYDVAQAQIV